MTDPLIEDRIVELIEWLETTAIETKAQDLFKAYLEGANRTAIQTGYYFKRIESEGILEVKFWFTLDSLNDVVGLTKENGTLKEWLDLFQSDYVTIALVHDQRLGECLPMNRHIHIPKDQRNYWISTTTLDADDLSNLRQILKLKPPD